MTRTMYDSIHPLAIPLTATMVAGYVDGAWPWMAASNLGWVRGRWPAATRVRVAVFASTNDGAVLDVEAGDATPTQAPGWVTRRRAAGVDPTVYCNSGLWPAVRAAFHAANVTEPHYWVAAYPGGGAAVMAGTVAHQYADPTTSGGDFDLSAAADHWPGVDPGGPVTSPDSPADDAILAYLAGANRVTMPDGRARNAFDAFYDLTGRAITANQLLTSLGVQLTALAGSLSADEAAILAAVAGADGDLKAAVATLLTAIQAIPRDTVDPVALAAALETAGLPAQLVTAFVAALAKATGATA
jgi:hypothetical protein